MKIEVPIANDGVITDAETEKDFSVKLTEVIGGGAAVTIDEACAEARVVLWNSGESAADINAATLLLSDVAHYLSDVVFSPLALVSLQTLRL